MTKLATREQIVKTALSQVGTTKSGASKYYNLLGFTSYVEWCSCFVTWVFFQYNMTSKGSGSGSVPHESGVERTKQWFKSKDRYKDRSYKAKPGDLIVYDWNKDGLWTDHIGIVVKTDDKYVYSVEGNTGRPIIGTIGVWEKKRLRTDKNIDGYCQPVFENSQSTLPKPKLSWVSSNQSLGQKDMENNAKVIWDYLSKKGWSRNAVAAMLGNMQQESTINPGRWQSGKVNNMSGGFGLTQWTPATKIIDWQNSKNKPIGDGNSQLDRIDYERQNEYQWSTARYKMTFNEFYKSNENIDELSVAFTYCYERPANMEAKAEERKPLSRKWLTFLRNYDDNWSVNEGDPDYPELPIDPSISGGSNNNFQSGGQYYKFARIPSREETIQRASINIERITEGLFNRNSEK